MTDASRSWGVAKTDDDGKRSRARVLKKLADDRMNGGFMMAQKKTYHESVKERKSKAPENGFEAILPPASSDPSPDFRTNNEYAFGVGKRMSTTLRKKQHSDTATFAGGRGKVKVKNEQDRGLSGEVWQDGDDPRNNTMVQRAWQYGQDPAIRYKLNGYPVLRPEDVECTGLQVGEHERNNTSYDPEKSYRRVAKITKCSDADAQSRKYGRNVYMDENI